MPSSRSPKEAPAPTDGVLTRQLRTIIREHGDTVEALAQSSGVDRKIIGRFLAGERSIRLDTVDRLAEALGLRLIEGARGKSRPAPTPKRTRAARAADA